MWKEVKELFFWAREPKVNVTELKNKRSWSCIRINIRTLLTGQLLKLKVFSGHHG